MSTKKGRPTISLNKGSKLGICTKSGGLIVSARFFFRFVLGFLGVRDVNESMDDLDEADVRRPGDLGENALENQST